MVKRIPDTTTKIVQNALQSLKETLEEIEQAEEGMYI